MSKVNDRKEIQELSQKQAEAGLSFESAQFKEIMAKYKDNLDDPKFRHAMANIVQEQLFDVVSLYDLPGLIDKRTYAPNEVPNFFKRGKLRAYYLEQGSNVLKTQQTRTEFTVSTRPLTAAPSYNWDQFKAGRYGDLSEQSRLVANEFAGKKNKLFFDTITASIPSTSAYGNYKAHAGKLTKTVLDTAIDYVNQNTLNGVLCVIGLHKHMSSIIDFQDRSSYGIELWTDAQKAQFMRTGMIDFYRGAPIIALKQYIDGFGIPTIPDNEVLVLAKDPDTMTWLEHGPFDTIDGIDFLTRDWTINFLIRIGMYVFEPSRNYRIRVSGA